MCVKLINITFANYDVIHSWNSFIKILPHASIVYMGCRKVARDRTDQSRAPNLISFLLLDGRKERKE
jgi:hypothetical protein